MSVYLTCNGPETCLVYFLPSFYYLWEIIQISSLQKCSHSGWTVVHFHSHTHHLSCPLLWPLPLISFLPSLSTSTSPPPPLLPLPERTSPETEAAAKNRSSVVPYCWKLTAAAPRRVVGERPRGAIGGQEGKTSGWKCLKDRVGACRPERGGGSLLNCTQLTATRPTPRFPLHLSQCYCNVTKQSLNVLLQSKNTRFGWLETLICVVWTRECIESQPLDFGWTGGLSEMLIHCLLSHVIWRLEPLLNTKQVRCSDGWKSERGSQENGS